MSETMWDVVGTLGFALMIGFVILVMKLISRVADRVTARAYTPLAQAVGGHVDPRGPWIVMTHRGWQLRAALDPQTNIGMGESSRSIKTFWVQVLDVPGRTDWEVNYFVTGVLGGGVPELALASRDHMLTSRLTGSGVAQIVAAGSSPTTYYRPAHYEARGRTMKLVDDVSQHGLPTPDYLLRSAELAVRLAEINVTDNPPLSQ
jgi:hypothetical protein